MKSRVREHRNTGLEQYFIIQQQEANQRTTQQVSFVLQVHFTPASSRVMTAPVEEYLAVLRAAYDYDPQSEDEIAIKEGQIVFLLDRTDDELVLLWLPFIHY